MARLRQIGEWIGENSEAIYETVASSSKPGRNVRYTHKGDKVYLFCLYEETPYLPPLVHSNVSDKIKTVRLLRTGENVPFTQDGDKVILSTSDLNRMSAQYADCFAMQYVSI